MTAGENVTNCTFVALHDLHEVGEAVEHFDRGQDRVVTNLQEANLAVDLEERIQVVSKNGV